MEKLREETVSNIRAVLVSVKGKCELSQVNRDYRLLMGTEIPYRRLGYSSLEELMHTIPTLTVSKMNGMVFIDAVATAKTAHISEMVQRQKTAKRKPPKRAPRYSSHYHSPAPGRWRPKNVSTKWKTTYQNSPRPAAMSHNQFVNIPSASKYSNAYEPPKPYKQPINNNNDYRPQPKINTTKNDADLRHRLDAKKQTVQENDLRNKLDTKRNNVVTIPKPVENNGTMRPIVEELSGESDSSACSNEKVPHSIRTNRANLMKNLINKPRLTTSPPVELLKLEGIAAVDTTSSIWNHWTSTSSDTDTEVVNGFKKMTAFQPTGDAVQDLTSYCKYKKLAEPVYKSSKRQSKPHKPAYYDFSIKVAGQHFSSYPKDFTDMQLAKNTVAQTALECVMQKYSRVNSMLLSEEADILERIPPIVEKHFYGVWSSQLEADYKDLFQEQLPENWLQIIDMCPKMSVTRLDTKYILRYCRPEDKGKPTLVPLIQDVSIPASTVQFTDKGFLIAEITCAVSGNEIWCRQLDTPESEAYDKMITNLEHYYNHGLESCRAKTVSPGSYYAAMIDLSWYRIRVLGVDGNNVECLLLDRGDDQVVTIDKVFQLPREFAKQQAQAFICRLAGLEELYEVSVGSQSLQNLEGMAVHLEPSEEEGKNNKYEPVCVFIYDLDNGDSINQKLISLISIENALPQLLENGPNEVYISHIEPNGDIYVQQQSLGYEKLQALITDLESSVIENPPALPTERITRQNAKDRLYFSQYKNDQHWYRSRIIDWSPCGTYAQIYFIDYGDTDVVKIENAVLYPLEDISSVVAKFPEQAIKVRMHIQDVPDQFEEKIREIVEEDSEILLMMVERDASNVPRCRFFTRVPNVGLVSINDSISISLQEESEKEILNIPEKLEKLHLLDNEVSPKGIVPSSGNLKIPPIPAVSSYFDVQIPFAVNPWNFFVQPYDSRDKLTALMVELQSKFADVQYSPLQIDDVLAGHIYASKHDDGIWYRTSVIKIINPSCISVFYCDFGYYATIRLQQLVPLEKHLLTLPFQAIKAKLSGIKPKHSKWTMDDCKYFQKQVLKKTFVSVLTAIEKDELYRCDTVLCLKLIDTSTDVDVDIEELLVRKKIAVTV